jgi:two-component system CheB/CheR fusion protein
MTTDGMDLGGGLAGAVLDTVSSLVLVLDRTGRIVRFNRACERVTGTAAAEALGRFAWDAFVVPEEAEAVRAAFVSLLASRAPSQHENRWRTQDGEIRVIAWSDAALLGSGGEVELVVGTGTDVTERRWAEEDLLRSNQALRALIEASPLAICVLDREGLVRVWSPAAERIFGWTRREVLGRHLPIVPEDRRHELPRNLQSAFEGRPLFGTETVRQRKDGSLVDVAVWTSLLRGPQDEPESILAVIADISDRKRAEEALRLREEQLRLALLSDLADRKRAEEELRAAKEAVEAASQAKDHFLAVLSHELRTPLTPVLATVSTLERDPALRRDLRDGLAMIRRNVELEARLIDDLLDLTRIARGKLELHRQRVDAREILHHAVHICCAREVASGRLRLEMGLTPGDYRVWADGPRLTQVFWNLLNNAVKFTPDGGGLSVRARLEEDGGRLSVEISDTGIGIEPEILPRVFGAFAQADRRITRRFGGLGLGLAVSKAILELHGGSLTASSAGRGRGATFTVHLPVGEAAVDLDDTIADLAAPPAPSTLSSVGGGEALRILLVEDHADTAAAMAELLRLIGHRVTVAASVAAGLAAAEAAHEAGGLDLVVSDLGLPDGSGLDLMRELVRRYGLKGIALSGYGMEEDLHKSREAGFARHLTKPVSLQTLQTALRQVAAGPPAPPSAAT